jgi:FxsC-like protein
MLAAFTREGGWVHSGVGAAVPTAPYFFLSYVHTPRLGARDSTDPDLWVDQLFRDLRRHVVQVRDLPRGANPGFMDKDLHPGEVWPESLGQALATCQAFVPLYSRRYFTSADCGREWFYFNRRELNHAARGARPVQAIIPAVWSPVNPESVPDVARSIRLDDFGIKPYAEHGFWGIMKLSRYRDAYEEAVYRLAQRIVEVAERSPLGEGPAAEYDSLESAFGDEDDRARLGEQRLRITVAAPRLGALPDGSDRRSYGPHARDWNPYQPDSVRPIGDHAAALARGLGYRVDIGDLEQHEDDLLSGGPPAEPQVLIVDPWALMQPRVQEVLERIDSLDAPWVQVVVPWSNRERESPEAEARLRAALDATLKRKLTEVRRTSAMAGHGVPTLDDFGIVLPKLILTTAKQYLRHAQASPPAGPAVERPRLGGFVGALSEGGLRESAVAEPEYLERIWQPGPSPQDSPVSDDKPDPGSSTASGNDPGGGSGSGEPPDPSLGGPGEPDGGGDDDDPQIINIWIGEREINPTLALSPLERYTLVFRVGLPHPGNIAEGPLGIPRRMIPIEGLVTKWMVSSTDVALPEPPAGTTDVQVSIADSSAGRQWMAQFELTVPAHGDSAERHLAIMPLSEGQARIEVKVSIAGDLYRVLKIDLTISPPSAAPQPVLPAPAPSSVARDEPQSAITTTVTHATQLRQVAPEPTADWQVPATQLNITFEPPGAHLDCVELRIFTPVRWAPKSALIERQIQRVRNALDDLRVAQQAYFNGIDQHEFAARLAEFRPSPDWAARTGPSHHLWPQVAKCPELRDLAQEGHVLYQYVFDSSSDMRNAVDALQPGDMLSLTWFPGEQHIAHVPWALMYRKPPPPAGEPIDAEDFLGIRLRLRYMSHPMLDHNRSLGDQDSFTRAHLMYWGNGGSDLVAIERDRHLQELQRWRPYVLPSGAPGKPQVVQFLDNPAPSPVRLVYIYCKAMAGDQHGPGFRFGNGPRDEDTVTLSEIRSTTIPDRPLVFANACGTAAGSPFAPNELEERFFLRGCSAFIGTECKVPITLAARFATAFFHFLYAYTEELTPAGEAIVQARRFFWTEYGILGGLFYSYVNDYHLYVATDAAVAALSRLRRRR